MNIAFDCTLAASKNVAVLADPLALTTSNTSPYGLRNIAAHTGIQFIRPVIVTGLSIVGDLADAPQQLGYWDTVGSTFVSVYNIEATELDGGGIVRDFGEGFLIPLSSTVVLAFKNRTDDKAVRIAGDVRVFIPGRDAADQAAIQAAARGLVTATYLLDENNDLILDDAGSNLQEG